MKTKKYKFIFIDTSTKPVTYSFGNRYNESMRNCKKYRVDSFFVDVKEPAYSETALSIMLLAKFKVTQRIEQESIRTICEIFGIRGEVHKDHQRTNAVLLQHIRIWEEKVRVLKEKPEYIFEIVQQ